jgi:hypothetical protein
VALDSTIQVAGQLLETAEAINEHAATIESALTSRAVTDGHL